MKTPPAVSQALWAWPPPAVHASIEALEARPASRGALEARVAIFEALVQALQEQRNQTSRPSARPPSSALSPRTHPRRPRSKRRRGGPPGPMLLT
jgi:hypothetical protein